MMINQSSALLLAPFPLGLVSSAQLAGAISVMAGTAILTYSLFTNYDFGVVRTISVGVHLGLDLIVGAVLISAALRLGFEAVARAYLLVMGLGVLTAVAATNTKTKRQGAHP
jgi:hypothetical protein